jgi:phage-related protein
MPRSVAWEGDSLSILKRFPADLQRHLGYQLHALQMGERPWDAKPIKTGMPGAWELRAKDASGQYRLIYVQLVREQIHVLHCFKKASQRTSRKDLETAQTRYRALRKRLEKGG